MYSIYYYNIQYVHICSWKNIFMNFSSILSILGYYLGNIVQYINFYPVSTLVFLYK